MKLPVQPQLTTTQLATSSSYKENSMKEVNRVCAVPLETISMYPNHSENTVSKTVFPATANTDIYLMVFTDVDAGETITISDMKINS